MKKIISILIASLFSLSVFSTDRYISTTGSNGAAGTIGAPWRNLWYACNNSTSGDIIHVISGTFLETQQSNLPVGVSIVGEGVTSIIQWTGTAQYEPIIYAASPEGTNGNQSISYLMFDGRSLATSWAINIRGRSNFSIHHCTFQNFQDRGVVWGGRNDNADGPPTIYATGNSFHDNIMNNCATCNGTYGTGNLGIGGQDGMLIYNNTITQNQRAANQNGWPIKYWNEGHLRGVKIYDNVLTTQPIQAGKANGDDGFWDFGIELFYEQGLEIYGNIITGSIDVNYNTKGTYAFTFDIHDNIIGFSSTPPGNQCGVIMEFDVETGIVRNNTIRNCADGIVFSPRAATAVSNTEIRNNLLYEIGSPSGYGRCIGNYTDGNTNWTISNTNIYNNTIICRASGAPFEGISINDIATGTVNNVRIRNNIVQGTNGGYITTTNPSRWSNSFITHNNGYNNAYNVALEDFGGTATLPGGNTVSNNLVNTAPSFVTAGNAYTLNTGSAMIDAGVNVGLSFNGAAPDLGYAETGGADVTPPTVSSTSPANGAVGVSVGNNISVTFNENLNGATVTTGSASIAGVTSAVSYSSGVITINPNADLAYSTTYTVTITTAVTDVSGNALAAPYVFSFTTSNAPSGSSTVIRNFVELFFKQ